MKRGHMETKSVQVSLVIMDTTDTDENGLSKERNPDGGIPEWNRLTGDEILEEPLMRCIRDT